MTSEKGNDVKSSHSPMGRHDDTLIGIRLKLKRAWNELDALKADIHAFIDTGPYRPSLQFNRHTGRLTVYVHVERLSDPMWSIRVGEIVHNFRSPLDHAVWELARRPMRAKAQFPIFETEAGFDGRRGEFLRGVPQSAVRFIKSEQPFFERDGAPAEGKGSPLWHLKELSDADKHRLIHLTAGTLTSYKCDFAPLKQATRLLDIHEHQGGPIKQDTILWSGVLEGVTDWPFDQPEMNTTMGVEVAFEEGTPSPGMWGVFATLAQIGNRSERILRRIAEDFFGDEL